jgi:hypothetical protein
MSRYFYAASFPYGRYCTTGEPHPITGRMSLACRFYAFTTKRDRDAFVNCSFNAEPFTKKGLRSLSLGTSVQNFNDSVKYAELLVDA